MSMNWTALALDAPYKLMGVDARLHPSTGKASAVLRVLDKTRGASVAFQMLSVETLGPAARVRAKELAEQSLEMTDLDEARLDMNGTTWRVESCRPLPTPGGEADGEVLMLLVKELS